MEKATRRIHIHGIGTNVLCEKHFKEVAIMCNQTNMRVSELTLMTDSFCNKCKKEEMKEKIRAAQGKPGNGAQQVPAQNAPFSGCTHGFPLGVGCNVCTRRTSGEPASKESDNG